RGSSAWRPPCRLPCRRRRSRYRSPPGRGRLLPRAPMRETSDAWNPPSDMVQRVVASVVYQIFVSAFGGLDGVVAHLDHVAALGADAVYLTPVFAAPSAHKYDTTDFDVVDEEFGGAAAFERLAGACRARRLGLIFDGVFNHVGEHHRWLREHPDWFTGAD